MMTTDMVDTTTAITAVITIKTVGTADGTTAMMIVESIAATEMTTDRQPVVGLIR